MFNCITIQKNKSIADVNSIKTKNTMIKNAIQILDNRKVHTKLNVMLSHSSPNINNKQISINGHLSLNKMSTDNTDKENRIHTRPLFSNYSPNFLPFKNKGEIKIKKNKNLFLNSRKAGEKIIGGENKFLREIEEKNKNNILSNEFGKTFEIFSNLRGKSPNEDLKNLKVIPIVDNANINQWERQVKVFKDNGKLSTNLPVLRKRDDKELRLPYINIISKKEEIKKIIDSNGF